MIKKVMVDTDNRVTLYDYVKLSHENGSLRDLLKRCKWCIECMSEELDDIGDSDDVNDMIELLTEIEEALDE